MTIIESNALFDLQHPRGVTNKFFEVTPTLTTLIDGAENRFRVVEIGSSLILTRQVLLIGRA